MTIDRRTFMLAGGSFIAVPSLSVFAQTSDPLASKPGLRLLNDRPLNAETPAHLLDDDTTPTSRSFVRNNGHPPMETDPEQWQLRIEGESCVRPTTISLADLKSRFEHHTYDLQLECGGNGRAEFRPRASGNQWTTGAIGCPRWTGVRLRDVLVAGLAGDAELSAQTSHLLAIEQTSNETQALFHDTTLLPGHVALSRKREKVLPMCPE